MAKVTMQDIADELGISRISVWKVFNNVEGVSESLRSRVLDKASDLGYGKIAQVQNERLVSGGISIALLVSRPDSSSFWSSIIHSIALTLSRQDINVLYIYVPSQYEEGYTLPPVLRNNMVQGIISLNIYDTRMLELINKLSARKVFLDITTDFPFMNLTGSLVLLEGKATTKAIVTHLIEKCSCNSIGFIGDTGYALTNKLRYEGYVSAMREHGLVFEHSYLFSERIGINEYHNRIFSYLDSIREFPDAIVCVSDFVAAFVYEYFLKNPSRIRKPLLVTGYDGSSEYPLVADKITTAVVNNDLIGRILADKILTLISQSDYPKEISYIFPKLKYVDIPLS